MPSSYRVHRVAGADPQTVWNLLADASTHPSGNPARFVPDMIDSDEQCGDAVAPGRAG